VAYAKRGLGWAPLARFPPAGPRQPRRYGRESDPVVGLDEPLAHPLLRTASEGVTLDSWAAS